MEFLVAILIVVVIVEWLFFQGQIQRLRDEVRELRGDVRTNEPVIRSLIARVFALETHEPQRQESPPVETLPPPTVVLEPEPAQPPSAPPVQRPSRDIEALIGGNLLNKLGALILVIGIALFLGYSLTQLGPGGKVAIGITLGISLLASGVAAQKHERYATFARGLIGAGWAAIYFTTYAAHALDAARIITDPSTATGLLLLVSVMMIAHSFAYRAEPVTVLAYFIAFVTLNLTPATRLTLIAALLLAISTMVLARKLRWARLGIFGVFATYVTFFVGYDTGTYSQPGMWNTQILLWIYWLTFESYDLITLRDGTSESRLILPLNAGGFLACSVIHQTHLAELLTTLAGAYLVSTMLRARIAQRPAHESPMLRLFSGGWEPALFLSAAVGAAACIERFQGVQLGFALLIEVELLVSAGLLRKDSFLTGLGSIFSILPFVHLFLVDTESRTTIQFAGMKLQRWTPLALAIAAGYLANRVLTRSGFLYTSAAGACLSLVAHYEFRPPWATAVWAILAALTLAVGVQWNLPETRRQAYLFSLLVVIRTCVVNFNDSDRLSSIGLIVAILYGSELLLLSHKLEAYARVGYSVCATLLLSLLIADQAPGRQMTLLLGLEGIGVLAAGFLVRERILRLCGLAVFLGCIAKLFLYDLRELDTLARILSFIILGLMLIGASWAYTRYKDQIQKLL